MYKSASPSSAVVVGVEIASRGVVDFGSGVVHAL